MESSHGQKEHRGDEADEADPRVPGPRVEGLADPKIDYFDCLSAKQLRAIVDGSGTRVCEMLDTFIGKAVGNGQWIDDAHYTTLVGSFTRLLHGMG